MIFVRKYVCNISWTGWTFSRYPNKEWFFFISKHKKNSEYETKHIWNNNLKIYIINNSEFKKSTCFTEIQEPDVCLLNTETFTKDYVSCKMEYEDGCRSTGFFFIVINIKSRLLQNIMFFQIIISQFGFFLQRIFRIWRWS